MKANEFVKKFGWDVAIKLSNEMTGITQDVADCVACWGQSEWDHLKRLIESHELVMEFGDDASYLKEHLLRNPTIKEFYLDDWCRTFSVVRLKQAILDVESCQ